MKINIFLVYSLFPRHFQLQWNSLIYPWQAYLDSFSTPQEIFSLNTRFTTRAQELKPVPSLRLPDANYEGRSTQLSHAMVNMNLVSSCQLFGTLTAWSRHPHECVHHTINMCSPFFHLLVITLKGFYQM